MKTKFKKGDIVEVIESTGWTRKAGLKVGDIATVFLCEDSSLRVKDAGLYGLYLNPDHFELAKGLRYLSKPCTCIKGCATCNGTGIVERVIADNENKNSHHF
jgi:hypothetical protein